MVRNLKKKKKEQHDVCNCKRKLKVKSSGSCAVGANLGWIMRNPPLNWETESGSESSPLWPPYRPKSHLIEESTNASLPACSPYVPMCSRRGATSVQHCSIRQDGLSPGAIIQQCNVYWTQSSSNYVNGSGGGRPALLFKLWSGAGVCTAVLHNSRVLLLIYSEWELNTR